MFSTSIATGLPKATHMDANQNSLQDQWPTLKGQVQQRWHKLTAADLAQLNANPAELTHLLRHWYGYGWAQAEMEISDWVKQAKKKPRAAA
jgi:hypothetical protein